MGLAAPDWCLYMQEPPSSKRAGSEQAGCSRGAAMSAWFFDRPKPRSGASRANPIQCLVLDDAVIHPLPVVDLAHADLHVVAPFVVQLLICSLLLPRVDNEPLEMNDADVEQAGSLDGHTKRYDRLTGQNVCN